MATEPMFTPGRAMLPSWCDTPVGRALIQAVLADPPPSRAVSDDWGTRDWRSYAGKVAGTLRRLHEEWVEREYSALNRRFAIDGTWDAARAETILRTEDSNRLIERLLAEAAEHRDAA